MASRTASLVSLFPCLDLGPRHVLLADVVLSRGFPPAASILCVISSRRRRLFLLFAPARHTAQASLLALPRVRFSARALSHTAYRFFSLAHAVFSSSSPCRRLLPSRVLPVVSTARHVASTTGVH